MGDGGANDIVIKKEKSLRRSHYDTIDDTRERTYRTQVHTSRTPGTNVQEIEYARVMRVRVRDSLQPDGAVGYWTAHPLLRSETSTRNQTKYATTPHGHVMEGARSSRCRHVNSATRYIHSAITDRLRFWKTSFAHLVLPTLFCDKRDTPLARPVPDARRCARAFPLVPSHICVAQRLARRVCHPRRSHAMGATSTL